MNANHWRIYVMLRNESAHKQKRKHADDIDESTKPYTYIIYTVLTLSRFSNFHINITIETCIVRIYRH